MHSSPLFFATAVSQLLLLLLLPLQAFRKAIGVRIKEEQEIICIVQLFLRPNCCCCCCRRSARPLVCASRRNKRSSVSCNCSCVLTAAAAAAAGVPQGHWCAHQGRHRQHMNCATVPASQLLLPLPLLLPLLLLLQAFRKAIGVRIKEETLLLVHRQS
jgi:hypothetical protein